MSIQGEPVVTADQYFAIVPEFVLYADITAQAVRVYACLRRFADRGHDATPSHATIAERAQCSVPTVKRAIRELEDIGVVERVERYYDGRQTSNGYHLLVTPRGVTGEPHGGVTGDPDGGVTGDPRNQSHTNQSHTNQIEPAPGSSTIAVIPTPFDAFWSVYPKEGRREKPRARLKFAKAAERAPVTTIIAGAVRYRDDPNREPRYTKHAATWLHNDCWEDPALTPRGKRDVGAELMQAAVDAGYDGG